MACMTLSGNKQQAMLYSAIDTTPTVKCLPRRKNKKSITCAPAPVPRNVPTTQRPLPEIQHPESEVSKQSSADSFVGAYRGKYNSYII